MRFLTPALYLWLIRMKFPPLSERFARCFVLVSAGFGSCRPVSAEPIDIAEVKHEGDVDFEKEILPIFRRNCLACHSATEAESDLVLETPQTILKGGSEGPGGRRRQERREPAAQDGVASRKSRTCRRPTTT